MRQENAGDVSGHGCLHLLDGGSDLNLQEVAAGGSIIHAQPPKFVVEGKLLRRLILGMFQRRLSRVGLTVANYNLTEACNS